MSYLHSSELQKLANEIRSGMPLPLAVQRHSYPIGIMQALELCQRFGSPPVAVIERLALSAEGNEKAAADLAVAQAGPRASAKLVTMLPVIVLVLAQLSGLEVINLRNGLAIGSILLGALLLLGGRAWSKAIISRCAPTGEDPGIALDAFASGMQAGVPPHQVAGAVESAFGPAPEIAHLVESNQREGLGLTELALAEANRLRLEYRVSAETRIRQAGVKLMWPLGLLVLPAFVLMAVIPITAAMLQNK